MDPVYVSDGVFTSHMEEVEEGMLAYADLEGFANLRFSMLFLNADRSPFFFCVFSSPPISSFFSSVSASFSKLVTVVSSGAVERLGSGVGRVTGVLGRGTRGDGKTPYR